MGNLKALLQAAKQLKLDTIRHLSPPSIGPLKDAAALDESKIPDAKYPRSVNTTATFVLWNGSSMYAASKVKVVTDVTIYHSVPN